MKYILFLVLSFFVFSCNNKHSDYHKLETFFNNYNIKLKQYDYLVVINEQGDCLNCNNKFSKAIAKYVDSDNVLYLISTPGFNIDVSSYIKDKHSNVLLDYENNFSKLKLTEKCSIIDLGSNNIDTIIQIDVSNVNSTIKTFKPHQQP